MKRISAIVLAAGESARMGAVNKLTLPVKGVSLLRHSLSTLLDSMLYEIVVVLGHEPERVRTLLAGLPIRVAYNAAFREGQMSSVYCGMAALKQACEGVMVCLADQPLLTAGDIDCLGNAFIQRPRGSVLVPTYRGQRGNPVVLDYAHRNDILNGTRNLGCRRLIERNPQQVITREMANDHVVFDIDTPDNYQQAVARLALTPHLDAVARAAGQ